MNLPANTFEVSECNNIALVLQDDGRVTGQIDCSKAPIQVPSPMIRHCLGFYPLASLLSPSKPKNIVQINGGANTEAYVAHVFPAEDRNQPDEQTDEPMTYLRHYQHRMSPEDPYERRTDDQN